MDLSSLTNRAKELFKQRGGTESVKQDAQELKDISRSEGSTSDKAKQAFEAIKEPGKPGEKPGE
jgi:hypothetical protein